MTIQQHSQQPETEASRIAYMAAATVAGVLEGSTGVTEGHILLADRVIVADKAPNSTLDESPQILLWYNLAVARIGDE